METAVNKGQRPIGNSTVLLPASSSHVCELFLIRKKEEKKSCFLTAVSRSDAGKKLQRKSQVKSTGPYEKVRLAKISQGPASETTSGSHFPPWGGLWNGVYKSERSDPVREGWGLSGLLPLEEAQAFPL